MLLSQKALIVWTKFVKPRVKFAHREKISISGQHDKHFDKLIWSFRSLCKPIQFSVKVSPVNQLACIMQLALWYLRFASQFVQFTTRSLTPPILHMATDTSRTDTLQKQLKNSRKLFTSLKPSCLFRKRPKSKRFHDSTDGAEDSQISAKLVAILLLKSFLTARSVFHCFIAA